MLVGAADDRDIHIDSHWVDLMLDESTFGEHSVQASWIKCDLILIKDCSHGYQTDLSGKLSLPLLVSVLEQINAPQ